MKHLSALNEDHLKNECYVYDIDERIDPIFLGHTIDFLSKGPIQWRRNIQQNFAHLNDDEYINAHHKAVK